MWASGIIMYLVLVGKHPLYESGVDNSHSYNEKLIRCNPSLWASEESEGGKYFSPMARDFFTKLCNPIHFDRYTAE